MQYILCKANVAETFGTAIVLLPDNGHVLNLTPLGKFIAYIILSGGLWNHNK